MQAWVNSQFCPRCGIRVKEETCQQSANRRRPTSRRGDPEVEILPPASTRRTVHTGKRQGKREIGLAEIPRSEPTQAPSWSLDGQKILQTIREKPLQAAVGGVAIGAATMAGGAALAAAGAQVATLGGIVAGVSGAVGLLGVVGSLKQGGEGAVQAITIGVLGTLLGTGIVLIGGVTSAVGAVIGALGTATVVVASGVGVVYAYQHREDLAKALRGKRRQSLAVPPMRAQELLPVAQTRTSKRRASAGTAPMPLPKRRPTRQRVARPPSSPITEKVP